MARDRGILRLMTRSPHDAVTPPAAAAPLCVESPDRADAPPSTAVAPEPAQSEAARAKAEKAIRMAAALRANLKRRKAPARTPAAPRDSN